MYVWKSLGNPAQPYTNPIYQGRLPSAIGDQPMPNPRKAQGDRAEQAARDHARTHGFPGAERTRAGYTRDHGDVHLAPGVIVQTKDCKSLRWASWLPELAEQKTDAGADVAALVVKRPGMGAANAGQWLAVMAYDDWLALTRAAGYGTPP